MLRMGQNNVVFRVNRQKKLFKQILQEVIIVINNKQHDTKT